MGQRVVHVIWDVLNEGPAKGHVQKLLAAADAQDRDVSLQGLTGDAKFECGPVFL